ncbi:4Fe-4S dicluster domain-containing protein [bacterium]|nr:4Fe-4S dicluster domain-containing protein [candidate division CSSED10-310 bacterium]
MISVMKSTESATCKGCYACVRACPSKAIRITAGVARIDQERCVHCGQCITVCSHGEWHYKRDQALVRGLINSDDPVAVILDTAFPAAFPDWDYRELVGAIRALGFTWVTEASFGVDLVTNRQKSVLQDPSQALQISTVCPAVVDFVRKFAPSMIPILASVVPPMISMSRVLRQVYGPSVRIVYASPCIAHKAMISETQWGNDIDAVITFEELTEMLDADRVAQEIDVTEIPIPSDFDPPFGRLGIYGGLPLGTAVASDYTCNPVDTLVVDASGPRRCIRILNGIINESITHGFIDMLFCRGCVEGCAMPPEKLTRTSYRTEVQRYARFRSERFNSTIWQETVDRCTGLDLSMTVTPDPRQRSLPDPSALNDIRSRLDMFGEHQFINCSGCGYPTCQEFIVSVGKGLAELDMCIQYQLRKLKSTISDLETSHRRMNNLLEMLHHTEKLANLAQLSAATAYKLNDPLSVVLLYSHLLQEEYRDNPQLQEDLTMILSQVEHVKDIFIDLLNLSARNRILPESVDARELVDRTLMVIPAPAGIRVDLDFDPNTPMAVMDREQMGCVLSNLVENAYEVLGGDGVIRIQTLGYDDQLLIRVTDNGPGIRKHHLEKIFDPFFTTKKVGVGAGLGLPVAREIVRQHQGVIRVSSNDNPSRGPTGTTFEIAIPRQGPEETNGGFTHEN